MSATQKRIVDISKNYINIQGFMVQDLNLKSNELILYALIYGFSQTTNTKFTGSLSYMMKWLSCSKNTLLKALSSLLDKGFITKKEDYVNNVKICSYDCVPLDEILLYEPQPPCTTKGGSKTEPPVQKNELPSANAQITDVSRGVVQKLNHRFNNCTRGGSKTELGVVQKLNPDNIYNNIYNNIYMIDKIEAVEKKIKEQIEYDWFLKNEPTNVNEINNLIDIMKEIMFTEKEIYYSKPTQLLKERISLITAEHIKYILETIHKKAETSEIYNIKAYLVTAIYNAPATIDSYYTASAINDGFI